MSHTKSIHASEFDSEVLGSKLPVLVDFWAPWCQPCLMMAPALDEISSELTKKLKVVKIDIDDPENRQLAMKYEIRSIPNMKLFRGGEIIDEFVGLMEVEALKSGLKKHLKA